MKGIYNLLINKAEINFVHCGGMWKTVESVEGSVEKFHTSGGEVVEFQLVVECLSVDAQ